ncbi:hypothetical protein JZ751_002760 [Albula glossodonta]|uniref:Uncharacterized protein n=1 Tax=Albula glossodonta TaxID=121402 RepID=A0A8T2N7U1_9TELE|nr:hypothetical protein JZ751_002760 [Albula glossodonta]
MAVLSQGLNLCKVDQPVKDGALTAVLGKRVVMNPIMGGASATWACRSESFHTVPQCCFFSNPALITLKTVFGVSLRNQYKAGSRCGPGPLHLPSLAVNCSVYLPGLRAMFPLHIHTHPGPAWAVRLQRYK